MSSSVISFNNKITAFIKRNLDINSTASLSFNKNSNISSNFNK